MSRKIIFLITIGLLSLLTILGVDQLLPSSLVQQIDKEIPRELIPYLVLINPSIYLFVAVILGVQFQSRIATKTPFIDFLLFRSKIAENEGKDLLFFGLLSGVISAAWIFFNQMMLQPYFSNCFYEMQNSLELPWYTKIFYGGLYEEILVRYGILSFLLFFTYKIKANKALLLGTAIFVSSLLFALLHLPILYMYCSDITLFDYLYVFSGNSIPSVLYGYIFVKRNLETACLAHGSTHIFLIISFDFILKIL